MATLTISLPTQFITQIDTEAKSQGATRSEFFRTILRKHFSNDFGFEVFTPRPLAEIRKDFEKTGKYNKKFIDSVMRGMARSSVYAGKKS